MAAKPSNPHLDRCGFFFSPKPGFGDEILYFLHLGLVGQNDEK